MFKFKNYTPPLTLIFAILLFIVGCSKLCNSGYEGTRCNELSTTRFVGKWNAVDTPGNLTYADTIVQGSIISDLAISSVIAGHRFSHGFSASVTDSTITIPYQQPDSDSSFVQGTGVISSDRNHITMSYQLFWGVDTPRVVTYYGGTWTRQN